MSDHIPLAMEVKRELKISPSKFECGDSTIILYDARPKSYIDDRCYEKNKDVWLHVPRGCAFIYSEEQELVHSLAGLPKFGNDTDLPQYSVKIEDVEDLPLMLLYTEKVRRFVLSYFLFIYMACPRGRGWRGFHASYLVIT